MGHDKSGLLLNGKSLLDHAILIARAASESVALLGEPRYETQLPYIADRFPGCGPLAGIDAALAATTAEFNFIVSVDTPFVPTAFVRYLVERARATRAVVTYAHLRGGYQPLCAIYRRAFGEVAELALQRREYKIDPLFSRVETCVVDDAELRRLGFNQEIFDNLNTPDDWERAQQRFQTR